MALENTKLSDYPQIEKRFLNSEERFLKHLDSYINSKEFKMPTKEQLEKENQSLANSLQIPK